MVLHQLFIKKPSLEIINKIIQKIGLKDINDTTEFNTLDIDKNNAIMNIKIFEQEIKDCYIPCKKNKYAGDINNKTIITILRQFLKLHDYDLHSKEKFIKGTKYLMYKIISKKEKDKIKKTKKYISNKPVTIVFD